MIVCDNEFLTIKYFSINFYSASMKTNCKSMDFSCINSFSAVQFCCLCLSVCMPVCLFNTSMNLYLYYIRLSCTCKDVS